MHCWWECKLVQPLMKRVWSLLKKLKIGLPYNPEIPLPGIFLKKTKTLIQKDICTPVFIAALFTIAKGTSLVVQWLRILLPMQRMQVRSLVGELGSHMPWGN